MHTGGTGEIRTLGTVARTHAFQACPFNHSGTVPAADNLAAAAADCKPGRGVTHPGRVGCLGRARGPYNPGVTVTAVLAVLASYLLGSVPAATWVTRARGVDIRRVGSGNSGATNVLRSLGKGPALAVAFFDIAKGAVAVLLARALGLEEPWAAACGVAAVVGHNFSPFLGFRGGKGVATSFGTIVALDPLVGGAAFVLAIFTMWLTRFVSAGSVLGAAAAIVLVAVLGRAPWQVAVISALALMLIFLHRENLARLHAGTERRLGEKAEPVKSTLN